MHSQRSRTRAFPVLMMLHHYNCFLFIIISPVTSVYVMLTKIAARREFMI